MKPGVMLSTSVPTQNEFIAERKTSKQLRKTVMGDSYFAPSERVKMLSNKGVKKVGVAHKAPF
jgi:hypothetical protein